MHVDKERFLSDKTYASGWVLYCSLFVLTLLSAFLLAKIVTEVIAWTDTGSETYPTNTINIVGEAEVVAVPDVAKFDFSINVTGATVEVAQQEAATKANAALAFLKSNGIDEKDIKTTGYNANPRYEYTYCTGFNCQSEQKLVGYDVMQTYTITVRDTEKAGDMLVGVGQAGITNVSGLSFQIDNPEKLKEDARAEAIANARAQAERLADDLGVKLKGVVSFNEDQGDYGQPYYGGAMERDAMMSATKVSPELPTGENTVKSRVYVTYEIK